MVRSPPSGIFPSLRGMPFASYIEKMNSLPLSSHTLTSLASKPARPISPFCLPIFMSTGSPATPSPETSCRSMPILLLQNPPPGTYSARHSSLTGSTGSLTSVLLLSFIGSLVTSFFIGSFCSLGLFLFRSLITLSIIPSSTSPSNTARSSMTIELCL